MELNAQERLEVGQVIELVIGPVAHGGHFVARHNGQVIFVRHGITNELVKIKITAVSSKIAHADVIEVLTAAPSRVSPPCQYAVKWVLEVIYDQKLQLNAKNVGQYLQDGVRSLMRSYPIIADVRGSGLFIGVEMMLDEKRPATDQVSDLMEFALSKGVLLSCDGPDNNVLKIKPPLVITKSDVDLLLNVMGDWLGKK